MMSELMVAGIDEAGRGCLAGAVIAAAVILRPDHGILGLDDSKRLSPSKRRTLYDEIQQRALGWSLGRAEASEIDVLNIHHASLLAMRRAFLSLSFSEPVFVRVDGRFLPDIPVAGEAVIHGDRTYEEIAAASILAKVWRDREMQRLDRVCPGYGFSRHKGYPTAHHLEALRIHGVSKYHRRSFGPVRQAMQIGSGGVEPVRGEDS